MRQAIYLAVATSAFLTGCANFSMPAAKTEVPQQDELGNALRLAAQRAVDVRLKLASMQAVNVGQSPMAAQEPIPAGAIVTPGARIDVDYVGPAENATKLISRILGWELSITGKRRTDVIVSLRHSAQDPVTILRDIGAQCSHRCDIHVELVEAGKSSIALTYRE